ncbi:hypothetical protein D3C75_825470 [compost metagenome]
MLVSVVIRFPRVPVIVHGFVTTEAVSCIGDRSGIINAALSDIPLVEGKPGLAAVLHLPFRSCHPTPIAIANTAALQGGNTRCGLSVCILNPIHILAADPANSLCLFGDKGVFFRIGNRRQIPLASIIGPQLGIRPGFRPCDACIRYIFIEMAIFIESEDGTQAEG